MASRGGCGMAMEYTRSGLTVDQSLWNSAKANRIQACSSSIAIDLVLSQSAMCCTLCLSLSTY